MGMNPGYEGKGYIAQRSQQRDAQNTLRLLRRPAMNVHVYSVPGAATEGKAIESSVPRLWDGRE
jgi:hypothetical protein